MESRNHRKLGAALWTTQTLLCALFLFAGAAKLMMPLDDMADMLPFPVGFIRFIAYCEILGACGLMLPGITRVQTALTPLAACGLFIIMVGAVVTTVATMDVVSAALPFVTGVACCFVAYCRGRVAPIRESHRFTIVSSNNRTQGTYAAAA